MTPDPFRRLWERSVAGSRPDGTAFRNAPHDPPADVPDGGEVALDGFPYGRFMALSLRRAMAGDHAPAGAGVIVRARYRDMLIGSPGRLHGGVTGALLEIAGMSEWIWRQGEADGRFPERLPKPISITVEYLRPALPHDLLAAARLARQGRRVVSVEARAWQADAARPVAAALMSFLLPRD